MKAAIASLTSIVFIKNATITIFNVTSQDAAHSKKNIVIRAFVTNIAGAVAIYALIQSATEETSVVIKSVVCLALRTSIRF